MMMQLIFLFDWGKSEICGFKEGNDDGFLLNSRVFVLATMKATQWQFVLPTNTNVNMYKCSSEPTMWIKCCSRLWS